MSGVTKCSALGILGTLLLGSGCDAGSPRVQARATDHGTRTTGSEVASISEAGVAGWVVGGVGDVGNGLQAMPPVWTSRPATATEMAFAAQMKATAVAQGVAAPPATIQSVTGETLQWAAAQPADAVLELTLVLVDVPFDWTQLQAVTDAARTQAIAQRESDLQPSQGALISRLNALGITQTYGMWLANLVHASVPNALLSTIAVWPELLTVEHAVTPTLLGSPDDYYNGIDRRGFTRADTVIAAGYTGALGGGASGSLRVQLADISAGSPTLQSHPGFLNTAGAPRFKYYLQCDASVDTCTQAPFPTLPAATHDSAVNAVMFGSIENGQDSRYPGTSTSDQIDRSGMASGARPGFFMSPEPGGQPTTTRLRSRQPSAMASRS